MFCRKCGKEIMDGSQFCQHCGTAVENYTGNTGNSINANGNINPNGNVNPKKNHKTLKIVLACVGGAVVLFVILGLLFSGILSGKNKQEILAVQNGALTGLEHIKMKDVVENYWKGGTWDCFDGETESGDKAKIVEYRKDGEGLIQFNVDDEERFAIAHFEDESHPIDTSDLMDVDISYDSAEDIKTCIDSLYSKYGYDVLSMKNIDLADYIAKDPSELAAASKAIVTSDDMMADQLHQLTLSTVDGSFTMIGIKGNKNYSPSFAGVCMGDTDYESKLVSHSYTKVTGDDGLDYYLEESTGAGVNLEVDEQGSVTNLTWVSNLADYTSWQTTDETPAATTTPIPQVSDTTQDLEEYIYPDSATRLLTEDDLVHRDPDVLRLAKNEIYARHGRMFQDAAVQAYFDGKSWYQGTIAPEDFTESMLSDIEKQNVQFLDNASSTGTQSTDTTGAVRAYYSAANVPSDSDEYRSGVTYKISFEDRNVTFYGSFLMSSEEEKLDTNDAEYLEFGARTFVLADDFQFYGYNGYDDSTEPYEFEDGKQLLLNQNGLGIVMCVENDRVKSITFYS